MRDLSGKVGKRMLCELSWIEGAVSRVRPCLQLAAAVDIGRRWMLRGNVRSSWMWTVQRKQA